ncbi:MAG: divalent-cation tolerance protein CutA [Thermoproteus sp.]
MGHVVVYITAPRDDGERIARHLVERRLAACVNVAPVVSVYRWEGRVERDEEVLLIVKTRQERLRELMSEVKAVHPYKVPEIIALPIVEGDPDYLKWVDEST